MSNYAGPAGRATPPLRPGEETGCCLPSPEMHQRYLPELPRFIQNLRAQGTRAGLYVRPRDSYREQRLDNSALRDGQTDLGFLLEWVRLNREEYGTDAVYIDTFGNYYSGEPLFVAKLFGSEFSADTVIEGVVDIYPCAYLLSGMVGGPQHRLDRLGTGDKWMPYPRFGRYLLNDRVIFIGESNGDWDHWGRPHDYWVERQAFLLGAKLDVMHPAEDPARRLGQMNRALERILAEWDRVSWWRRKPVYLDRAGIRDVPPGIDVRRFQDKDGETLLVIDNWQRRTDLSFRYLGEPIDIPHTQLTISVLD